METHPHLHRIPSQTSQTVVAFSHFHHRLRRILLLAALYIRVRCWGNPGVGSFISSIVLLVHFSVGRSVISSNAANPLSIPHAVGGSSSATFEHCLFVRSTKFSCRLLDRAKQSQSTAAASSKAETALDRKLWTASTRGGSNGPICETSATAPTE